MSQATLYTDGGARGNPGPAGIGFVLKIRNGATVARGEYIGEATNNQAEYAALLRGLQTAQAQAVKKVSCYLDSELVVKQLKGEYRVRHPDLLPRYQEVVQLARAFEHISFHHVRREKNAQADLLVNQAIDAHLK